MEEDLPKPGARPFLACRCSRSDIFEPSHEVCRQFSPQSKLLQNRKAAQVMSCRDRLVFRSAYRSVIADDTVCTGMMEGLNSLRW